ncbi:MAG TPA: hypothetical protein VNU19_21115 [Candidatus Acidoferrum sp.]|jgi:hypothetical protein|nr:hypothetical protein [Candidatus Acidoferrum sp.]
METGWRAKSYLIESVGGEVRDLALAIDSHQTSAERIAAWLVQRSIQI